MKPSHIRVFDGLRITTEHVNHLQGGVQTALQELREAIGVPKVYRGFEVTKGSDNQVIVHSGLAFDKLRNRVVLDEPKTIEIEFAADEVQKFVCVKYDQIEEGQVEGKPTLIWDSCSVVVQPTIPDGSNPLILLAKLVKAKGGSLEVDSLLLLEDEAPSDLPRDSNGAPKDKSIPNGKPPEPSKTTENTSSGETSVVTGARGVGEGDVREPGPKVEGGSSNTERNSLPLRCQQGTLDLASETDGGTSLKALLLESLQSKFSADALSDKGEVIIPLANRNIETNFSPSAFSVHTLITVKLDKPDSSDSGGQSHKVSFVGESVCSAEVTIEAKDAAQFGISTFRAFDSKGQFPGGPFASELNKYCIARLPLEIISTPENLKTLKSILGQLEIAVKFDGSMNNGVSAKALLIWKGGIEVGTLSSLQHEDARVSWQAQIGWKGIGVGN